MAVNYSAPFELIGDAEDTKVNKIWFDCWANCMNDDCRFQCVNDLNNYLEKKYPGHGNLKWTPVRESFNQEIGQQKYLKNVETSINNTISICGSCIIVILVIIIILLFYFHTRNDHNEQYPMLAR